MRHTLLLAGLAATCSTSLATSQRWVQASPAIKPPGREHNAMAYDISRQCTVLFGGYRSGDLGDTWEWDGVSWTHRIVSGPVGRYAQGLAYDSHRRVTVMFGGARGIYFSSALADTWEWDGNTWRAIVFAASPPPRYHNHMVYDRSRQRMVLVGTSATGGPVETWEYDGANWALAHTGSPGSSLTVAERDLMAYDVRRQRTVRAVYYGSSDALIWEWDGVQWLQRHPSPGLPSSTSGRMVYDESVGRLVAVTGTVTSGFGVWEWDGGTTSGWQKRSPASEPYPVIRHGMAFDSARKVTVLFGGRPTQSQTWEYSSSARAATVAQYGNGCGLPNLDMAAAGSSKPLLGGTFLADITNAPTGAAFAALGTSQTMFRGFALPLPLDGFGMTGCWLHHNLVVPPLPAAMTGPTTSQFSLTIPTNPVFLGGQVFLQAWAPAPAANPRGIITSNGLDLTLGTF
ncbi:MAG: hypothetical protein AAF628_34070 [Planctomycetota bacterium]